MASKWLRDQDGSECSQLIMERNFMSQNSGENHDSERYSKGEMEILSCNFNPANLESGQKNTLMGDRNWRNLGGKDFNGIENDSGPMDLVLIEENDPLVSLEGNKRQGGWLLSERQMSDFRDVLDGCGLNNLGFVEHFSHSFSDHCLILSDTSGRGTDVQYSSLKVFRFEAQWYLDPDFEDKRFHRNKILGLERDDGSWVSTNKEMLQLALTYFKRLFAATNTGDDDHLLRLVEKRITNSMNDKLLKPFTEEEITCAVKSMSSLKAPSIDGFPAIFYQSVEWDFLAGMMSRMGFHTDWIILIMRYDCILFEDASEEGANTVRSVITEYEQASGRRVNFDKSLLYFGANVDFNVRELVTGILGVRVATNLEKYLGLPMMVGRKKKWAFAHFVDRFRKKNRWLGFALSFDGSHWFPGHGNNRLAVQNINTSWTNVNQLIDPVSYTWRKEVLSSLFDDDQMNCILSIPLASHRMHDMLVWKHEATGDYSV
ncbi:hypothetical protein PVK06_036075 [Gossypium arboreum]|uniref:Reverse transcriptase n=1 Tax=Gossypium arboreum TaxID=29729 RepID=A0ABR0NII8_GOSAR|nr:hypothetical protein PVK06_036075 [Gossypium arboreum]